MNKILKIEEFTNFKASNNPGLNGKNGSRLGLSQMINILGGYSSYDGYKVETEKDDYFVLIDNGQCCCEDWGYFSSEDDFSDYIGADLISVELTDTELNKEKFEKDHPYGFDCGGIQFVDFVTSKGTLQLAVYNGHNGYYGHGIYIVKGTDIILEDVL